VRTEMKGSEMKGLEMHGVQRRYSESESRVTLSAIARASFSGTGIYENRMILKCSELTLTIPMD